MNKIIRTVSTIIESIAQRMVKKNAGYGGDNITMTGRAGVITRLTDKTFRLYNIAAKGGENFYEDLDEVLGDIIGYCMIWYMLVENRWPLQKDALHDECIKISKNWILSPEDYQYNFGELAATIRGSMLLILDYCQVRTNKPLYPNEVTMYVDGLARLALVGLLMNNPVEVVDHTDPNRNSYLDLRTGLFSGMPVHDEEEFRPDPENPTE